MASRSGSGDTLQFQAIFFTLVRDAGERDIGLGKRELVSRDTFDLMPLGPAGDDETEVADLWAAGGWPIDLVDDPVSKCCPDTTGTERSGDHVLGTRCPGGRNPRPARRRLRLPYRHPSHLSITLKPPHVPTIAVDAGSTKRPHSTTLPATASRPSRAAAFSMAAKAPIQYRLAASLPDERSVLWLRTRIMLPRCRSCSPGSIEVTGL
jgi:hypothetical protein